MSNHIIIGIVSAVIALFGLGLFLYSAIAGFPRFAKLTIGSKILVILFFVIGLSSLIGGGYYSFINFTYKPPVKTKTSTVLQKQLNKAKENKKEYEQLISNQERATADLDSLYDTFSKEGKTMLDSWSQSSEKTKTLILRNIGRAYIGGDGLYTNQLKTLSGEIVRLNDKKDRVLFFADDSEYSLKQLSYLKKYQKDNQDKNIEYLIVFPTLDGTKIEAFFNSNNSEIGEIEDNNVVTVDSMAEFINFDIYRFALEEFGLTDLPSYIAIDSKGVVSNAGVGSIVDTEEKFDTWINNSFFLDNKLYNEIVNPLKGTTELKEDLESKEEDKVEENKE